MWREHQHGRIAPERIAGWRQPAMGSIDRTRDSGTGLCPVRCARRCRGVCRRVGDGVPRADDSSAWESSGACRWPPVRIRFVHHWIAQSGRASVLDTECRGFEPRSKAHDLSRHDIGTQVPPRERPVRRVVLPRWNAEDGVAQRGRRRHRALDAEARSVRRSPWTAPSLRCFRRQRRSPASPPSRGVSTFFRRSRIAMGTLRRGIRSTAAIR